MTVLTYFRSKIATIQQEIRDAAAFLRRYDTEQNRVFLAIAVCVALFLALTVAADIYDHTQQPTPPVQASTLLTL